MLTFTSVYQKFFGATRNKREEAIQPPAKTQAMQEAEDMREFLLSIANLPAEEREKRIRRREALKQIVERQGVLDVEAQARDYWKR